MKQHDGGKAAGVRNDNGVYNNIMEYMTYELRMSDKEWADGFPMARVVFSGFEFLDFTLYLRIFHS